MMEYFDVLTENGEFEGRKETREVCHEKGLWHRAVYAFIVDENKNILLQKRSANKKLWPNKWDVTIGGHVNSGEFGRQALIRECKEELGIESNESTLKFVKRLKRRNSFIDVWFIKTDVAIENLKLQEIEVDAARWVNKDTLQQISVCGDF